ncbi:amino acid permease 3 [Prunus yedoensis var. nudiflora]|uniref:Amino acid permease 3 n=1 Tax=Prunus yedoensis var. nudiflora TaxID=2094558 RepID=A0A314YNT5_PRUYE|nr:amino acid permease 3 [Prunus yedoensis var. nudiflora]
MGDHTATRNLQLHHNPVFDVSLNVEGGSNYIDDDGRPKRTGTVWTSSAHIITAVIGSGVLSLAWAMAQLGWIAGPIVMVLFSFITYYTSILLAACYRDPVTGKRNYTYSDAVRSNLGALQVKFCGCVQNVALFGISIGFNIAAAISMVDKGFHNPYWLINIANAAIVIHLVGAYQVFAQPIFALVEKTAAKVFPDSQFITKDIKIPIPGFGVYNLNLFRLVWRTFYVIITTLISMILPFFNDVVGFLGALAYWPLTVYFPVEMYIAQKKVPKWSTKWIFLQIISLSVLVIALAAAAGSVSGVVQNLKIYKPFKTSS